VVYKYEDIAHFKVHNGPNDDGEVCYYCELCLAAGEKAPKPTLYYNVRSGLGYCQRCKSIVVSGKKRTVENVCADYLRMEEETAKKKLQEWDISNWTAPLTPEFPEAYDYVTKERGVPDSVIREYGLRYCERPRRGIVIPNGLDPSRVTFFQLRALRASKRFRYVNLSTVKPVYGDFLPGTRSAVVAEGPFSAMSTQGPDRSGLGLYGKSASNYQLNSLDSLPYQSYTVCLDGGEASATLVLAEQLLSIRDEVYVAPLPPGQDPNDVIRHYEAFYRSRLLVTRTAVVELKQRAGRRPKNEIEASKWELAQWSAMRIYLEELRRKRIVVSSKPHNDENLGVGYDLPLGI